MLEHNLRFLREFDIISSRQTNFIAYNFDDYNFE